VEHLVLQELPVHRELLVQVEHPEHLVQVERLVLLVHQELPVQELLVLLEQVEHREQ
jgi:hypothetical protein